ncbi:MAG: hypothetical protein IPM89_14535 [Candidatus Competibacteraceae bacterium]|nr:MAG: hypothetical protein IPM89_14535 [Candidatus Competibacteraceae bacterium]
MSEDSLVNQELDRDSKGRFVKGRPGGPGRPHGYKLRLVSAFYQTLYETFEERGKDIMVRALSGEDPKDALGFLKMICASLPKQVALTDEEGQTLSLNAIVVPAKQPTANVESD